MSPATSAKWPDITTLKMYPQQVLHKGQGLATGGNSGYQAVNLAYLMGAREIYLLGVDCKHEQGKPHHWHGDHNSRTREHLTNPNRSLYKTWIANFARLHAALEAEGVKLVNCSRDSALTIPRMALEDVI